MSIALPIYAGVYSVTISLLAVQFIYRYWALFSLNSLKYFRGWKSLIWFLYCLFFGLLWSVGEHYTIQMDEISENYFKKELLTRYGVLPKDIPMLTFIAYDPVDGSVRWLNVTFTIMISSIMGFQYGVMIYCGWRMYSKMEEKIAGLSNALKHHHRQLFKTLVLQITCPTLLLFSPLVLIIYLPFFQIQLSFPAGATVCAFNIYPAMDSVIVLMVVTEYRVAVKRMWKNILKTFSAKKENQSGESTGQITLSTLRNSQP